MGTTCIRATAGEEPILPTKVNIMALFDEVGRNAEATSVAPRLKVNASVLLQLFPLIEAGCIVLISIASGIIYDLVHFGQLSEYRHNFGLGVAAAAIFSPFAHARGLCLCPEPRRLASQIKEVVLIWSALCVCLFVVTIAFELGDELSLQFFMLFFVAGLSGIIFVRLGVRRLFHFLTSADVLAKPQVVIVSKEVLASSDILEEIKAFGCNVCQTVTLPAVSSEKAFLRCIDDLIEYVRTRPVDEILLATGWAEITLIEKIAARLRVVPTPVTLLQDQALNVLLERPLVTVAGRKAIELQRAPLSVSQLFTKRLCDLTLTIVALPFLLMPLAVVAILIAAESRGPVLFCQRRVGFNGREFKIYKFRTMTTLQDGPIVQQAFKGDPRVTRVGRTLRRFSIDELPQLWNVIRGDMSLVGPRPHALAHDSEYSRTISFYAARHNVKPGITGWAQINGWRGATPHINMMTKRVECDLWYVSNWSVWLDMKILLLTSFRVWSGRNAC